MKKIKTGKRKDVTTRERNIHEIMRRLSDCLLDLVKCSEQIISERAKSAPAPMLGQGTFITRTAYAETLCIKDEKLKSWQRRFWSRGVHYTVVGRTTIINIDACNSWLQAHFDNEKNHNRPVLTEAFVSRPAMDKPQRKRRAVSREEIFRISGS